MSLQKKRKRQKDEKKEGTRGRNILSLNFTKFYFFRSPTLTHNSLGVSEGQTDLKTYIRSQ